MKMVSDQIYQWVPGGLLSLGTDGYGRSETREHLREHFEVNAEMITVATLYKLSQDQGLDKKVVAAVLKKFKIKGDTITPFRR